MEKRLRTISNIPGSLIVWKVVLSWVVVLCRVFVGGGRLMGRPCLAHVAMRRVNLRKIWGCRALPFLAKDMSGRWEEEDFPNIAWAAGGFYK